MKNLLTYLLLTLSAMSFGQTNLDSLWGVWNDETQNDTNRLYALNKISWQVKNSNPDSAIVLAQMQFELAESAGSKKDMARALTTQGVSFYIKGDPRGIEYLERSLKLHEETGR